MEIDSTTWRKDQWLPIGNGYDARPNNRQPSSIIVHTTNGNRGSSLAGEAKFLRDSQSVSAHYLVGKDGEVIQLLPDALRAWHAGVVLGGFYNSQSLGIECHHAVGESWTPRQRQSVTELAQLKMMQYRIAAPLVETHRAVALPTGRKVDPSDWGNTEFYAWRSRLMSVAPDAPLPDRAVIGVAQSCSFAAIWRSYQRHEVPVSQDEAAFVYSMCQRLDIDAAFAMVGLWHTEDETFGRGVLQRDSHMPFNVKAATGEWRRTVSYNSTPWLWAETFQLGMIYGVWHLKNVHGSAGRHSVRQIVANHAPSSDGNDVDAMCAKILKDMEWVAAH